MEALSTQTILIWLQEILASLKILPLLEVPCILVAAKIAQLTQRVLNAPLNSQIIIALTIKQIQKPTTDKLVSVSGQQILEPFYFAIFDIYSQIVNIENSAIGRLQSLSSDLVIDVQDQSVSTNGLFEFTQTQFTKKPGFEGTFAFDTDIINTQIYKKVYAIDYKRLEVSLKLRLCTYGEAIEGAKCIICQPGYYSLTENAENCEPCPDHATCKEAQINPDPGYWRSTNVSSEVNKCYYQYACPGGSFNLCDNDIGYTGILCHECIYDSGDSNYQFTRKKDHQCARCPPTDENVRTYLLVFFGNQVYILFLTFSYYKNLVLEKENTVLLRILTTYSQIINLIGSFDLNWPTIIQSLFEGLAAPATVTEALYSVDCLLKDFNITGAEKSILYSLMITSLQPLIQFALSIFGYFFAWVFRVKQIKIKMLVTMTVIYYLTYPKIVKDTFSLFTCTDYIDGKKYLVKNTEIECFGGTHLKLIALLALPNMFVWIFGIPLLILYGLYKKRNDLDNEDNLRTYGFWYLGCKRKYFYWELLLEAKKLMMISITVDVTGMGQSYQAFLILMVLYFYFILSSNMEPYKTHYLNKVSYYAEFAQLCTFAFMMVYLRESSNIIIDNLVFILLLFMNSLYLLRFAYYYAKFMYGVLKTNYESIRNKIKKQPAQDIYKDEDFDNLAESSEYKEQQEIKRKRKRRKVPTGAVYKQSPIKMSGSLGSGMKRRDSLASQNQDYTNNYQDTGQQGQLSPETSETRKQAKIDSIKILKDKKKQLKRKMMVKDGPVGIKVDDYIREEKNRLKRERKANEQKEIQQQKEEEQEKKIDEDTIQIKDFDLQRDKEGHLLNQEVLDKIKKLL